MVKKTNLVGKTGLSANLLPGFYQTPANKKFLQATIDQLFQPGTVDKINGYIGRQNSKASVASDIFVASPEKSKQDYQLEPGVVIKDSLDNVVFFKDYIDYINQLNVFGANTTNHARINSQEFYSWDPHIDWDKFVNFQSYYWLPYGPDSIEIFGQKQEVTSTYTVELQEIGADYQYVFTPDGLTRDPLITLYRGQTYKFEISSSAHPFSIKLERSVGRFNRYINNGIDKYAVENGTITFKVPLDSPSILYYQSEADIDVGGVFQIQDIDENTYINVEKDILGKKTYFVNETIPLSNGMKVRFGGRVEPELYATGQFYVEGVGSAIKLIPESILEIIGPYTVSEAIKFDATPFDNGPFSDATGYASVLDHVVINRASRDRNPWSRYNRWFHKDVISLTASYNKTVTNIDQLARATRPIIEFQADLKLFNFGTLAGPDVNLIDTFTVDIFSTIEGSAGYSIDGVALSQGQTVLFTSDTDPLVNNKIYRVDFLQLQHLANSTKQIHLVEISKPIAHQSVLVKNGIKNQSLSYWFDGTTWKKSQQKTNTNQNPQFDVYDKDGVSFGDTSVYYGSTFTGTSLFSYKKGTGIADKVLGFPLTYKNVSNIGDIVFNFDLGSDSFEYKQDLSVVSKNIDIGYLLTHSYSGEYVFVNGWKTSSVTNTQAAVRIYKNSNKTNNFEIDIFDNIDNLTDLIVKVYVNGKRLSPTLWSIVNTPVYKKVVLTSNITLDDILTIKSYTSQPSNSKGFYELPVNLQNNPLNDEIGNFTLGEVLDHVNSIVDNLTIFSGVFPGAGNLRDLGNITAYGTKFVQHSGPLSLSLYHITSEDNNVIKAVDQARDDYNVFKRAFIDTASNIGVDGDPVALVDLILEKLNRNKPNTSPYYFSDMVPYGANLKTDFVVEDYRILTYPLTTVFSLSSLSNKAVGVYLNGTQLIYGKDYTFNSQGFVELTSYVVVANGDTITTYEYENTDGSFIPETPSKLGIWPKYEPKIFLDTTFASPRLMIQGHDGSLILSYGDYRDNVILELEKRIFNNIKVEYDEDIYDVNDVVPSYNRTNPYSREEFNNVLSSNFYKWAKLVGNDYATPLTKDYNYTRFSAPNDTGLPGYWRGVYRWLLDTDRPNICPWEMLGFSLEPAWWQSLYGPAPYTSDNRVMWQDISDGLIREPGRPAIKSTKYAKPFLINRIPVDEFGNIISPIQSGLARGVPTNSSYADYVFGDVGPAESAWRRSSHYPFSIMSTLMLLTPSKTFGVLLDRSRTSRNVAGQLVYTDTQLRIRPKDIVLPSTYETETRVQTSGLVNYLVQSILSYVFNNNLKAYTSYKTALTTMNVQLSYRVGAFTNKDQFKLLLDSKTPSSTGSVFIPAEDYDIVLNKSNPIKKLSYSGVIITKLQTGYQINGYSQTTPYFNTYTYLQSGSKINIGGISEGFTVWTPGQQYAVGSIVKYNGEFYQSKFLTKAGSIFEAGQFTKLMSLPINGGADAILRKLWDRTNTVIVPYGKVLGSVQEVVDLLTGYGEWLKDQGFAFNEFNTNLGLVSNWETSAKEFMFWSTQNWSSGQDKWSEWVPGKEYSYGTIVRYNGDYYSAARNIPSLSAFDFDDYVKLESLNNYGSSVISLSPSAGEISFVADLSVVEDIDNRFNSYEIFKVDGTTLPSADLNSYRSDNLISYSPKTVDGIFSASFYLVQYEHVVVINNTTIFNDVIYSPASGYRQERIKVSGYVTNNWNGSLDVPGFIFDQANIQNWQQWQDYNLGDIVVYQSFYYSANSKIPGTTEFNRVDWTQLSKKPEQKILPNWTNSATQFEDFYSLDSDSFDLQHQKVGQHIIGYQKREYLSNIIQDDVSEFKFYQGMIREKGTQNVFNKLFDVLSSDNKESLKFYEEWAIRVGQYGASTAFQQIEFILDETSIRSNPQQYVLVNEKNKDLNSFLIQVAPGDVYLKPDNYDSTPWPDTLTYKPLLRSAGYVNSGDVALSLKSIEDIVSQNPSNFSNGDYIWCSFEKNSWNVYRISDINLVVTSVTYDAPNKKLTIQLSDFVNFEAGSYIGITQTTKINGFYKIESVELNSFVITKTVIGWQPPFDELDSIKISALTTQRLSSLDVLDTTLPEKLKLDELIWIDNDGTNKWSSWKYNPIYNQTALTDQYPKVGSNYGRTLAVTKQGDIAALSTTDGKITTFVKPGVVPAWTKQQLIQSPQISANINTGFQYGVIAALNVTSIESTLTLTSPGSGYSPSFGTESYTSVPLTGGTGSGAVANITVKNGSVFSVTLVSIDNQYVSGEVLSTAAINIGGIGSNFATTIVNTAGSGYTPTASTSTYIDVPLTGGSGTGATADITVKNGKIVNVILNQSGTGYQPGNNLSVNSASMGGTGSGFLIPVLSINLNSTGIHSTVIAFSNDKKWMAVGSPKASYAATKFVVNYVQGVSYSTANIVYSNGIYYQVDNSIQSIYTNVLGTSLTIGQGARFTVVVTGATFSVKVISGGAGYKVGNKLKILGTAVGGVDTVNDIIITVTGAIEQSITAVSVIGTTPAQNYLSLPAEVILGTGATFNVTPTLTGYTLVRNVGGAGYLAGDKIKILGSNIGGRDILHDLIVTVDSVSITAVNTVSGVGISSWKKVSYIPVNLGGTNSLLLEQGAISLYEKDPNNNYNFIASIVSPQAAAGENFGSSLVFGNNCLYVSATGYDSTRGKIYRLNYADSVEASSAYNPVGSSNSTIVVTSTSGIREGMFVQGTGFSGTQYVISVLSSTTLLLSGNPSSTPSGILNFVTTDWAYDNQFSLTGTVIGNNYASSLAINDNFSKLLVSASNGNTTGKVYVYDNSGALPSLIQTITGSSLTFGQSISITPSGNYFAVSDDFSTVSAINQTGEVDVYALQSSGQYIKYQDIIPHLPESSGRFGSKLSFMNDDKTLVIYSQAGDIYLSTSFDEKETTFDKNSTSFRIRNVDSGRIDVYDRYNSKWVWSETLPTTTLQNDGYGIGFAVGSNQIFVGAPFTDTGTVVNSGTVYNYGKLSGKYSWSVNSTQVAVPDITKIKSVFLYNKVTGKLLTYLDTIDPLQGKIAGPAEEEIKYKTFYDPATYSIGTSQVNVDETSTWGEIQTGTLWWDLRNAKFINSYDANLVYRNSTWNTLATGSTIDIYEWVETNLLPSKWDAQADTPAGITLDISGQSLYGDTVYATKQIYDKISKTFKNKYYFWVKNKKVIPDVVGRKLSASDVSSLISNPRGQAYSYLALTGLNSFSLTNIKNYLNDRDVVLSIEYWTTGITDQNIHNQYKLISTDPTSNIPNMIEQKWFDSLSGTDSKGLLVPDMSLPDKLKYGIENRPRQSMFVNRFEALKQFVETANRLFITEQIAENSDISDLDSFDQEPNIVYGLYDTVLDTDLELGYANITGFIPPKLTPVIVDGKIVDVLITVSGKGYLVAPFVKISGAGVGAEIKTTINTLGQVTGVTISSQGEGYGHTTKLSVRNYSVLVHSDTQASDRWSIYSYDNIYKVWSRTLTQSYDVRQYWKYVDWYATGFNQFVSPDYAVNTFVNLNSIDSTIGDIVKVRVANAGGWLLVEKYNNSTSVDWTASYRVIGIENGTIQLSPSLYQFTGTNVGYDSSTYDGDSFDVVASVELKTILNVVKNKIFINELKQNYLDLFFESIRYVFSEQLYIDWIFKTSFVKTQHNIGQLDQPVNYPVDNLSNFEDYVNEVKPYKTKIREYVSNYDGIDTAQLPITDFDLQPIYNNTTGNIELINVTVNNGVIQSDNAGIQNYPWKFWLDNNGFSITEIVIVDGGSGYFLAPTVTITSPTGTGATARAFFTNGKVNRIILLTSGTGYLQTPVITIDGGYSVTGTQAKAIAIIGNSVVRSAHIGIKFDRTTQTNYVTQIKQVETYAGNGSTLQFNLKWAPDIRVGKSSVTVNNIPVLRENYTLKTITSITRGFTSFYGQITFAVGYAPANNSTVVINYNIDETVLNASDRIQYHYTPGVGQLGRDLSQLMTGIDYGGVVVNGLGFNVLAGWDSSPFFQDKWDNFDPTFDDFFVTVAANTHSFTMPYIPTAGTAINIYHIKNNVDTYTLNGISTEFTYNILANAPIATTVTTVPTAGISVTALTGNFDTTLKVSSTTGIVVGMAVQGTGFPRTRTVTAIIDATTVLLNAAPDSAPSGTLVFSYNYAGSTKLTVNNTATLYVGDVLACATVSTFTYDTVITGIINSTTISINKVLYANIPNNTNITATRTLVEPNDIIINANGTLSLTSPLTSGVVLNITGKIDPTRLDDTAYGTSAQTNTTAILTTPVSNGSSATFTIPNTFVVATGDVFILRKSTSDGSVAPSENDYDTSIKGGDLAYSTATGLAADDILVDGDGFVTPTSSPAPEEVVPGQVVDSVAIKVFDRPQSGSSNIKISNFIGNGSTKDFTLPIYPNSNTAIIVKVGNNIKSLDDDYTLDYKNKTVSLKVAPTTGQLVTVFNIGFNGSNILDLDYFIGDGVTSEFITKAPWQDSLTTLVYINGEIYTPELFKTDGTYEFANAVGLRFGIIPPVNSLINFTIVSGNQQTFAVTKTEKIAINGTSTTYPLVFSIGNKLPNESNMIVRAGQNILPAPNNSYFKISSNRLNYTLDSKKTLPYSVAVDQINVFADGVKLNLGSDYTIDLSGITVKINRAVYTIYSGKQLVVSVVSSSGYVYDSTLNTITFGTVYPLATVVEIISSYNHNILDIERTSVSVTSNIELTPGTIEFYEYTSISNGTVKLDRSVIDDNYIWVIRNTTLLVPSIDYKLNDDKETIQLAIIPSSTDKITLITFSSNVLTSGIAYMQFKDMLNRVHFKRLSLNKRTTLARNLKLNDLTIVLADATNFDVPNPVLNRPGVIEIRGERIEYFSKQGNVLGKLRRGTLGTGAYSLNTYGTFVQDIGPSETVPYIETSITEQILSDGTAFVNLPFTPKKSSTTWTYGTGYSSAIPANFGQSDDVEVFVGGYDQGSSWTSATSYTIGTIVNVGSYTYRCIVNHISSAVFSTDSDNWKFFIGNIRLKKSPYKVHNVNNSPYSPEGDVQLDADFSVDGTTNRIRLTNLLNSGTQVTVVKRTGIAWDNVVNIQNDTSKISEFLKASPGIWYSDFKQISTVTTATTVTTFDSNTSFDNTTITFDQG